MINNFIMPKRIITGTDLFNESLFNDFGNKCLIVTDCYMKDYIAMLYQNLDRNNIQYIIFSDITGEPTDVMIDKGLKIIETFNPDFVIGIGGGSALDSAKLIAANKRRYPFILIPTTAGTGSEATKFSILTYTKTNEKKLLTNNDYLPDLAILDFSLTYTMPKNVTMATGIDAFCHALEALTSKKSQSLSDDFALSAIKRIIRYLPESYHHKTHESRKEMALASLDAGIAFNNSSVTLIHGMSRPLGAFFHIPHGIVNAILLRSCMKRISQANQLLFDDINQRLNIKYLGFSSIMEAIDYFYQVLDIPTLKDYDVTKDKMELVMDDLIEAAFNSGSPQNTRMNINEQLLRDIYLELLEDSYD